MRHPFRLLAAAALLAYSAFASADQAVPLTVGDRQIKVSVPDGYVRTSQTIPALFDITAAALPQSNRLVEYFLSEADFRDMMSGKAGNPTRPGFQVQVMKSVEGIEISAADWQLGRAEIAKTMGLLDANELMKADTAKANERMSEAAGTEVEVSYGEIGKPQVYGNDPNSLRFSMRVPLNVKTATGTEQSVISCVGAVTVLNGRLVFLYAYGDEKQLPELRAALDRFVDGSRALL